MDEKMVVGSELKPWWETWTSAFI